MQEMRSERNRVRCVSDSLSSHHEYERKHCKTAIAGTLGAPVCAMRDPWSVRRTVGAVDIYATIVRRRGNAFIIFALFMIYLLLLTFHIRMKNVSWKFEGTLNVNEILWKSIRNIRNIQRNVRVKLVKNMENCREAFFSRSYTIFIGAWLVGIGKMALL